MVKFSVAAAPRALSERSLHLLLLGVIALAAGSRIALALSLASDPLWPDGHRYNAIALHILSTGQYPTEEHRSAPLNALILAATYSVFGVNGTAARVVVAILGTLTCWVLYGLTTALFGKPAGIVAALLLAVYPLHVYMSGLHEYPQTVFIFLLCVAIAKLVSLRQQPRAWYMAASAGLPLGLAIMAVPTIVTAVPLLVIWLLMGGRGSRVRSFLDAAGVTAGCVAIVLAWSMYAYFDTGVFRIGSGTGGEVLFKGNCALAWQMGKADIADRYEIEGVPPEHQKAYGEYHAVMRQAGKLPAGKARDAVYKEAVQRFWVERPREAGVLLLRKACLFWRPHAQTVTRHGHNNSMTRVVQTVSFVPVFLLAGASVFLHKRRRALLVPIYAVVLSQWITYAFFIVNVRYRLHADVFLIVLAAPVVIDLSRKIQEVLGVMRLAATDG